MADTDTNMSEAQAQLLVSMRIYDVLLAIYTEMTDGSTKADDLMSLHAQGKLLGPLPALDLENIGDNDDFGTD